VVHTWPQVPQLVALPVVSTQLPLHRLCPAGHPETHAYAPPPLEAHDGVLPEQASPHVPQLPLPVMSVSQPRSPLLLQWLHPAAHEDRGNEHAPDARHCAGPLTWGSALQS
jgi:hypothetical protein